MLQNLHVKNLALIDEAEVEFQKGLNIFTGETGAGKSLLLGSVSLALGAKASKDLIRGEREYALVELLFSVESAEMRKKLQEMGVLLEDGQVLVSRKLMDGRSVSKVNGQMVSLVELKSITSLLLNIHGQHEHQTLLNPSSHLKILDEYAKNAIDPVKRRLRAFFSAYREAEKKWEAFSLDEEQRIREMDFLRYEIQEITEAQLREGEEEELAAYHKKMMNARKIAEVLSRVHGELGNEAMDGVGERLGHAVRDVGIAAEYDEALLPIQEQLANVDALLSDVLREIASYQETLDYDEKQFEMTEKRLDVIRNLEYKYGETTELVLKSLEEKIQRLSMLEQYEEKKQQAQEYMEETWKAFQEICGEMTQLRKKSAIELQQVITDSLKELNFLDVKFEIHFEENKQPAQEGADFVEFFISTNPGETVKPIGKIASGGELSRIMLAIKTILSEEDGVETLLFDEIDAGISGRTAQMVAGKLKEISKRRQVLCITHLPQIAAMADSHFLIEKGIEENRTVTTIHFLDEESSIQELARLLGGIAITDTVYQNAREMKQLAERTK